MVVGALGDLKFYYIARIVGVLIDLEDYYTVRIS